MSQQAIGNPSRNLTGNRTQSQIQNRAEPDLAGHGREHAQRQMQQNKEKVTGQEMKDDIGPNSEKKLHPSAGCSRKKQSTVNRRLFSFTAKIFQKTSGL